MDNVIDIRVAAVWRDAGREQSRLARIRARKALRAPFVYTPNDITHKKAHHKITLGGGTRISG